MSCAACARRAVEVQAAKRDLLGLAKLAARTGDGSRIPGAKEYLAAQKQQLDEHVRTEHGDSA